MPLLALFIIVPLIEIALFIQVGSFIGLFWTLAIVVVTAIIGTTMVRQQGRNVLSQIQNSFNDLRDPSEPLAHGAMILFSGALLLTPGFFTDTIGFLLLIPKVRQAAFHWLRSRVVTTGFHAQSTEFRSTPTEKDVIDGEFEPLSDSPPKEQGPSGWTRH